MNIASHVSHPDWPWLTRDAVRFLDLWLKPTDVVFEWGSGRSTVWLARRVAKVISIERNSLWYATVKHLAARWQRTTERIDLLLVPVGAGSDDQYARAIDRFDQDFDLIVVDGDVRDACALNAIGKLKPGGLLLVDNANWFVPCASRAPGSRRVDQQPASEMWSRFCALVSDWRRVWTTNGVSDTAMWLRPPTTDSRYAGEGAPGSNE